MTAPHPHHPDDFDRPSLRDTDPDDTDPDDPQSHHPRDATQSSTVDHSTGSPPLDDFASRVLDVVDSIPAGRVMSYGDIAEYLGWVRGDKQGAGLGPRQVGRVMSVYGGAVAWWRVIHSDGTPAPGHDSKALRHYLAEGTPLRSARPPVRVDMRRARWPGR
jgi:alkylated DNA nucleotide flippase Atl1